MIKTAEQLITQAQEKIACLNLDAAWDKYTSSEDAIILDVREAQNAEKSKLEKSINISRGLVEMKFPKVCSNPDTLILIHCGGGGRASLAAATLSDMGYNNVFAITAKYEDIKQRFG